MQNFENEQQKRNLLLDEIAELKQQLAKSDEVTKQAKAEVINNYNKYVEKLQKVQTDIYKIETEAKLLFKAAKSNDEKFEQLQKVYFQLLKKVDDLQIIHKSALQYFKSVEYKIDDVENKLTNTIYYSITILTAIIIAVGIVIVNKL